MSTTHEPAPEYPDDAARDAEDERNAMQDREAASALRDPATQGFFTWVRGFVRSVLETDYDNLWPGNLLKGENIWQWARFELLDWLLPIERLLRRILLIEAYALLETQSLPPARPGRKAGRVEAGSEAPDGAAGKPTNKAAARPADDPDHPEHWRVNFRVLPRKRRDHARRHVRMPLPRGDDGRVIPLRFRAVAWDAAPLARRFEAVIRICRKPAPFVRRLAFRLRAEGRRLHESVVRLCAQRPTDKFARDANSAAASLALERSETFWSSS